MHLPNHLSKNSENHNHQALFNIQENDFFKNIPTKYKINEFL